MNQKKLRAKQSVHLNDAVANDVAVRSNDLGQVVILPSSFVGSSRYLSERAQDSLTYVKNYGRPDLLITMTCNPKWEEIVHEVLPGQKTTDRHDVVARIYKKVKTFFTKGQIFGADRCWMITVEWQKRGLPHIHVLLRLFNKIQPQQIDSVFRAEIPDHNIDSYLHDLVVKHMVQGPCGAINPDHLA